MASSHLPTASSTSRYLLHVIPPRHLPHDTDDLAPVPATASGYHTQFRRGVLVPVYSTLQSQLTAIAREYALPSTVGMVLYLITTMNAASNEEPGPRISEDIWKHIWTRVLKAEKDELLTPGPKPLGLGLGYGIAGRSSPALLQDVMGTPLQQSQNLRALVSPRLPDAPSLTPSPSTPSQSAYSSQSEVDTPESASSVDPSTEASSIPLPGLESPSLVPVLAKVEFDIDRRNAGWYKAWVRSRRITHAKRAESRMSGRRSVSEAGEGEEGEEESKKAPMDLRLVGKMNKRANRPAFLVTEEEEEGYEQLDDDGDDELTARLDAMRADGDPLDDVFGTDAETWAEMRAESGANPNKDPKVVDLALDAAAVSNLPDDLEEGDEAQMPEGDDEAEVSELLDRMPKPPLTVSIPPEEEANAKRQSEPTTAGTIRKHVPPPLHLMPQSHGELGVPEQSPNPSSAGSAQLAYLSSPKSDGVPTGSEPEGNPRVSSHSLFPEEDDDDEEEELDEELLKKVNIRSPEDEKRDGAVFDDLDLGLDPSLDDGDYDDSDPYDRRKSQYIMAAQLDEIEKTLAQFSPRPHLQSVDLKPEDIPIHRRAQSNSSMRSPTSSYSRRSGNDSPPLKSPTGSGAAWPAVPYSALNNKDADDDRPPSPPKFAFNGVTTEPPKQFQRQSTRSDAPSDETLARQRALAEEHGLYPPLTVPNMYGTTGSLDSPVIPLSPDPFGRYPSEAEATRIESERNSQSYSDDGSTTQAASVPDRASLMVPGPSTPDSRPQSLTPSSRFSMESDEIAKAASVQANSKSSSPSLMSVKTIRKLWRKSDVKRESVSTQGKPESRPVSPNMPPQAPQVPQPQPQPQPQPAGRSRAKSISKSSIPPTEYPPFVPASMPPRNNLRALRFDQESPYPIHPVRPVRSPSPPRPVPQQAPPPAAGSQRNSVRKSILKSLKGGSLSTGSAKSSISSTASRSSTEQQPEPKRRRRPSMLDMAAGAMRSSLSLGSSTSLSDIPPSPALPEQYAQHNRSTSRPSVSSNASAASSPPRMRSPLMAPSSSPPRNGLTAAGRQSHASDDSSYESRRSFDASQFEIVSPPHGSLSYPYHGLDQSVMAYRD